LLVKTVYIIEYRAKTKIQIRSISLLKREKIVGNYSPLLLSSPLGGRGLG